MTAKDRYFGIEIECSLPRSAYGDFQPGGYGYGRGIRIPHAPNAWESTNDSSVRSGAGRFAAEIISPKLKGIDGLEQTWYMGEYLNDVGASNNTSCGLHVHVDATTLTSGQVNRVKNAFVRYERLFFALNGGRVMRRWNNRTYCTRSENWRTGDRFNSLNLTNVGSARKNTVEFRCFASTVKPETLTSTIYLCVALVEFAKSISIFDTEHNRIENPTTAWNEFKHILESSRNRIVPDEDTSDIIAWVNRKVREAKRAWTNAGETFDELTITRTLETERDGQPGTIDTTATQHADGSVSIELHEATFAPSADFELSAAYGQTRF